MNSSNLSTFKDLSRINVQKIRKKLYASVYVLKMSITSFKYFEVTSALRHSCFGVASKLDFPSEYRLFSISIASGLHNWFGKRILALSDQLRWWMLCLQNKAQQIELPNWESASNSQYQNCGENAPTSCFFLHSRYLPILFVLFRDCSKSLSHLAV